MEDGTAMTSHQVSDGVATVGGAFVTVASVVGTAVGEGIRFGTELVPFSGYARAAYDAYTTLASSFDQADIALATVKNSVDKVQKMHDIIVTFMSEDRCVPATDPCLQRITQLMRDMASFLDEMVEKYVRELNKAEAGRCLPKRVYFNAEYNNRAQGFVHELTVVMGELNAAVALWTAKTVADMKADMNRRQQKMLDLLEDNQLRLEAQNAELQAELEATKTALQTQQLAADQQRVHLEAQNAQLQA